MRKQFFLLIVVFVLICSTTASYAEKKNTGTAKSNTESQTVSKEDEQLAAQKKAVFKALEKVKVSRDLSYNKYLESVSDAKMEFNIYSRMDRVDDKEGCFRALQICLYSYETAGQYWDLVLLSCADPLDVCKKMRGNMENEFREAREKLDKAYQICFPSK